VSIVASLRKTVGEDEPEPLPGTPGTADRVGEKRPLEASDAGHGTDDRDGPS
jgi:hypothetical protein